MTVSVRQSYRCEYLNIFPNFIVVVGGLVFGVSLAQQAVMLHQVSEEQCSFLCTFYLLLEEQIC